MIAEANRTTGEFATEPEAWIHFDSVMKTCGAFRVHREVDGEYIQPRPQSESKGARVDRLLIPIAGAVDAGWDDGAIAVEGKASGSKLGPLITQALDYTRCVFRLEKGPPGLLIVPTWVFIYPLDNPRGDLESVMVNNRIGYVRATNGLIFSCGGTNGITIDDLGTITVKRLPMGRKRGSR